VCSSPRDAQPFLQADVPSARRLSQTLGRTFAVTDHNTFMYAIRLILVVIVAMTAAGCATRAAERHQAVLLDTRAPVTSLEAIATGTTKPIEFDQTVKGRLTLESQPIQLGSARGVFEAYAFTVPEPGTYTASVFLDCDCLGFSKASLVARVLVLDAAGAVVGEAQGPKGQATFWSNRPIFTREITWNASAGRFFVVVASSATSGDPAIAHQATIGVAVPAPVLIPVFIHASPLGPFEVTITRGAPT